MKKLSINHMKGYFLRSGKNTGWFLPEVFNMARFANMEQLVYKLATQKAKIDPSLLFNENTRVYSFGTDDFIEGPRGGALKLEGPIIKTKIETTEKKMIVAAEKAADWMLSRMDKDGGIITILNPYEKKIAGYDWARTIFSGWVLGEFGKNFHHKTYVDAAKINFVYNKKNVFDNTVYIKNKLLVLSYLGQQALSLKYLPDALLCAENVIKQLPREPFHPLIFSQIASFLGTVALRGNEKYLEHALRCADAIKNSFYDRGVHGIPKSIAEYAEFINTLLILYAQTGNKKHLEVSKEIALWILKNQLETGAFKNTENSNFSYTRGTSKTMETLALFNKQFNGHKRLKDYGEKMKKSFAWLLLMQYDGSNTFFIESREREKYIGGFRHDYINAEAWIDSAAHFILAVLRFYGREKFINKDLDKKDK